MGLVFLAIFRIILLFLSRTVEVCCISMEWVQKVRKSGFSILSQVRLLQDSLMTLRARHVRVLMKVFRMTLK